MSKNFVLRAAVCVSALVCATVVMEAQANAFFGKRHGGHHRGGCCGEAVEASCGAPAEEPSCGCPVVEEPSCGCPVVEQSCGCPAEEASCGCASGGRKFKLFGRFRNKGGCGSSCEPACGAPAEAACGAPAEYAPADAEAPPAPEAPAA